VICILKVILGKKKATRALLLYIGNCMRQLISVTETKVVDVINFINERVVALEGSLQ
jgi:hypothetical protein